MKVHLNDPLFQGGLPIMEAIEAHGYEAYFVGGCVRDTLLGRPIHDIDIASSARPEEIEAIFPHTIDLGKEHGTILVVFRGHSFEVTTFRTEGDYKDYRRPETVEFIRSLEEDTLRRDFTINAMALDRQGILYDYHQGLKDLDQRKIRAVGQASDRFDEDALRMMRGLRFASELGFAIEAETLEGICQLAPRLQYIAIERIQVELSKYLKGRYLQSTVNDLVKSRLFHYLPLPQAIDPGQALEVYCQHVAGMDQQAPGLSLAFAWACFCRAYQIPVTEVNGFLRRWAHSRDLITDVQAYYRLLAAGPQKLQDPLFVYDHSLELLVMVESYFKCQGQAVESSIQEVYAQLPIKRRQDMAVDGRDIIQYLGLKGGGPVIGQILRSLEKALVYGQLDNRKDTLLTYASQAFGQRPAD